MLVVDDGPGGIVTTGFSWIPGSTTPTYNPTYTATLSSAVGSTQYADLRIGNSGTWLSTLVKLMGLFNVEEQNPVI